MEWLIYEHGIRLQGTQRREVDRQVEHCVEMLKESGRFDAKQIFAVKQLVAAILAAVNTPQGPTKLIDVL